MIVRYKDKNLTQRDKMNKIIKVSIAVLITGATIASATSISLDKQIQQIQHAPLSQRFKLMNQFKIGLHHMNQQERMQAISTLRKQMHVSGSSSQSNVIGVHHNMGQYPNNVNQMQQTTQVIHMNIQQNQYQQQAIKQVNQQSNNLYQQQIKQPIRIPMH